MRKLEWAPAILVMVIILTAVLLIVFLPRTLVVPDGYATIQDAIESARAGDTVFVRKGIYNEALTIDKPLSLVGEESQDTIIINRYQRYGPQFVIRVSADRVTISGFTIKGAEVGIWVETIGSIHQPSGCRIIGNNLVNTSNGIHSFGGDSLVISENNITGNIEYGIYHSSSSSTISRNNIAGNGWAGIIVDSCNNVTINGNSITGNGIDEDGQPEVIGGLLLRWDGLYEVYGNNITDNQGYGIGFGEGCNNSIVRENEIERNGIGVNLLNFVLVGDATIGSGNICYQNNLIDNSRNAFVEHAYLYNISNIFDAVGNGTDIVAWNNGKEGNYWSDYLSKQPNATEVGTSGIGNTPYVIDGDNIDHYPLMQPVDISTASPLPSSPAVPLLTIVAIAMIVIVAILAVLFLVYRTRSKIAEGSPPAPPPPQP
jgi:nitrous oxidase accessory protein